MSFGGLYIETGAYSLIGKTGTVPAGLAAGTALFSARFAPSTPNAKAAIDRIRASLMSLGTGFAAGSGYLDAVVARSFTAADTGGGSFTLSGDNTKRMTAKPSTSMTEMRIHTLDLAVPVNATFTSGAGTLTTATYYYRVSALNANGETLASAETSLAITGPAGVNVNWGAVTGATGYKIYGRTTGAEQFLAQVGAVTTWLDGGSLTPAGALPTNLTAGTRTLDSNAFGAVHFGVTTAVNTVHLPTSELWSPPGDTGPELLSANEGFIVRATVPATGVWQAIIGVDWREVLG